MAHPTWIHPAIMGYMCITVAVCLCSPVDADAQPPPLKVLVITGTHEYEKAAFQEMFDSFHGMDCTIKEMGPNPGPLFEDVEQFPYDAIVAYNYQQTLSIQHRNNLEAILRRGVGLTVMHHAMAGFPDWIEFENVIGATYVLEEQTRNGIHYPRPTWKHGVDMNIKVMDPGHPITRGIEDFTIRDETYKGWVYHDGNHLLLSTDNTLSNREIAWTRSSLGTRVFYIQLGHDHDAFENTLYRRLLRQGIAWTANRVD